MSCEADKARERRERATASREITDEREESTDMTENLLLSNLFLSLEALSLEALALSVAASLAHAPGVALYLGGCGSLVSLSLHPLVTLSTPTCQLIYIPNP